MSTAAKEPRQLRGLEKVCKLHGRMKTGSVTMVWDYTNDVAIPEKEMHQDRKRWAASEKAKWALVHTRKVGHGRF